MTQVERQGGLSRGFLATEVAGPREKGLARLVVVLSLIGFAVGAPFAREPLAELPAFIPAYEAALLGTFLITAVLLFSQFSRLRSLALLMLASGYLFAALIIVPHALSFPGVVSETGLFGGSPQTPAWLYVLWHFGFPWFVLAYALIARSEADTMTANPRRAIAAACAAVTVLVIGLTLLTTAGHDLLPVVINGSSYSYTTKGYSPVLWLLTAAILVVVWWRSIPTVLEAWMMVVLVAWLLDIAFSVLLGSQRYDFGFYAGRVYGLLAASFVLATLLVEANRLYGNLGGALALAERRAADLFRSREEFAQLHRFEAISQLVSGVAHDFNNILTVISAGLDRTLGDPALDQKTRRVLEASRRSARRGKRVTQQLLIFANRQKLQPEILNPNEVIANLEGLIAKAAGDKLQVTHKLSPVLWQANVDRTQLETALLNLVINAREMINGTGELTVETDNATLDAQAFVDLPGGDYLRIAVADNGPGMPPEIAAHAFDPFFAIDGTGKASGLGLSQVYGFARRANGQARIVSRLDAGTRIEMYLPKSVAIAAQPEAQLAPAATRPANRETVLVVEDNPDVLDTAVNGLSELGYKVKTATDARSALDILRADANIEVLFSDVAMPGGMDGGQLAVEAQQIRPGLKVLLTSGHTASALSQDHDLPETLQVLPKPYGRDELASKLRLVIAEPPPRLPPARV